MTGRLCVVVHPTVSRHWLRWYPWLRVQTGDGTPGRAKSRSIILTPQWRRAEAERLAVNAARIYANATRKPTVEFITRDLTHSLRMDKAALRARHRERRRMIKVGVILAAVLVCVLAWPIRNQWCVSHGGHMEGGTSINGSGRIVGLPSCVGAK